MSMSFVFAARTPDLGISLYFVHSYIVKFWGQSFHVIIDDLCLFG